jgi:NAD(P)H-dependent flavin oxidoreductase YrpB (nitropropane dioxygenase family)
LSFYKSLNFYCIAGEYIKMFKEANITTIHKCVAVRHALTAQRLGVDAVSMDGFECAGHPGEDDITGLILLAKSARTLDIPFIASGGIGDGRGLAAALALGAEGVNMGSRFMCTQEAPLHHNIKEKMVEADERSTALVYRPFRNTARIFKNKIAVEVNEREKNTNVEFQDIAELVAGTRGKQVFVTGDPDYGVWTAGQVLGLINDIPTCDELVNRMVEEAESIITHRLTKMVQ